MNELTISIFGIGLGIIGFLGGIVIHKRRDNALAAFYAEIDAVERDLLEDIERIDFHELEQTDAGRELLRTQGLFPLDLLEPPLYEPGKLPPPQVLVRSSGKKMILYRDFEGNFISKARYEELEKGSFEEQTLQQPMPSYNTEPRPEIPTPPSPPALHVPTELLWPALDPIDLESIPPSLALEASEESQDYTEVHQLLINGKPYAVQVVDSAANESDLLKLRHDEEYVPIQVKSSAETTEEDKYVLVRRDSQPRKSDDIVVAMHSPHERVWAEWNPPPVVIADKQNERKWVFLDLNEDEIGEIQPIGVVEAVLTPVTSTSNRDQFQDLLDHQNDLQSVEIAKGVDPQTAKGLAGIRDRLQKHLATYHGLELTLIIVGETEFDPKQGHRAIATESHSDLPRNVIVKVVQDGFHQQGNVIQEALVIVN